MAKSSEKSIGDVDSKVTSSKEIAMSNAVAEVSSGKNEEQVAVVLPVAGVTPAIQADRDSYNVPVDLLDSTIFENSRKKFDDETVNTMVFSLKNKGQVQAILGTMMPNGKIAVVAGYTRTEAFWRITTASLINKYNKDNGLDAAEKVDQRLVPNNHEHRLKAIAAYPAEFEEAKNKHLVRVHIDSSIKTQKDARAANLRENLERMDLTFLEEINAFEKMIEVDGYTADEVATTFKRKPSAVSQMRNCRRLPDALATALVTPEKGEELTEEQLVKIKEDAKVLVDELRRRMDLHKSDKELISFSHLREFAGKVVRKNKGEILPLTRAQITLQLCALVGADVMSKKLKKGAESENYSLWITRLKSMEVETEKRRSGKSNEEITKEFIAEDTGTSAAAPDVSGSQTGTVAGLQAQASAPTAVPGPIKVSETTDPNVGLSKAEIDAKQAEAAAAESNADATLKTAASLVGGSADDLDDDVDEDTLATTSLTGEKSKKVSQAPLAQAKVKEPNVILGAVLTFIQQATSQESDEQDVNLALIASALGCAAFGYEMLSLTEKQKEVELAAQNFAEEVELYILGMEEWIERASKVVKKGLPAFDMERPVPQLAGIAGPEEDEDEAGEDDTEDFDDDVEFDEETDEESVEDAEALEEIVGSADEGDEG